MLVNSRPGIGQSQSKVRLNLAQGQQKSAQSQPKVDQSPLAIQTPPTDSKFVSNYFIEKKERAAKAITCMHQHVADCGEAQVAQGHVSRYWLKDA